MAVDDIAEAPPPPTPDDRRVVIRVRGLRTQFGAQVIHDGLDLDVYRGEVIGVVGGSGTGKSVLLRAIVGLSRPASGRIEMFGVDTAKLTAAEWGALRSRYGVLFQDGALFSSLTVAENIEVGMREYLDLPQELMDELAALKVAMVGLPPDAGAKYPSELSGGMRKRAGPGARFGARSRGSVSRRADGGARPDRRGRLRPAHSRPSTKPGADGFHGHARP